MFLCRQISNLLLSAFCELISRFCLQAIEVFLSYLSFFKIVRALKKISNENTDNRG
jgi:hypothetical protein